MGTGEIIKMAVTAAVGAGAFIARSAAKQKLENTVQPKKVRTFRTLMFALMIICAWYFVGIIISLFSGGSGGLEVEFKLFPPRTTLFGISFSSSTVITWGIIAVFLLLSLIFRFFIFPRFAEKPKGIQNVIEIAVESVCSFTKNVTGDLSDELPAYMFSVAAMLIGCAVAELFGLRPPTADLVMTFSLGLATFFLINFLSIKKKGIKGRIKGLASPSPIIFPMKVLSDISVPVSLACRLFGNMLGGMIVMELLKSSLGGYSIGLTALAGLYFNVFHPLIQTYIFIILSLTFINEAAEHE